MVIVPNIEVGWIVQLKYQDAGPSVLNWRSFVPEKVPVFATCAAVLFFVASASDFHTVNVCGTPASLLSRWIVICEPDLRFSDFLSYLMPLATTFSSVDGPRAASDVFFFVCGFGTCTLLNT